MKFGNLAYLYLLWIVPAMIMLAIYSFRKKAHSMRIFCGPDLAPRLTDHLSRRQPIIKTILLILGVLAIIVALLQPRWGFHWEEITRKGVDIIVALDVSESMRAQDVSPNRLERAKREITDLLEVLKGDRVGLVAFAGVSFLQCPLTLDYGAFKIFLDYLDTDLIPVQGTALAEAIKTALKAFVPGRRASRVLILITDGEDHEGNAEAAAEEAKANGVTIFTVGIGSEAGAPIPLQDGSGGFKKDREGNVVLTKLDETILQKIALATGGRYIRSITGHMDLRQVYEDQIAGKMEATELATTMTRKWEERFQWFLAIGIVAFLLEGLLPEKKGALRMFRWQWRRTRASRTPVALLGIALWAIAFGTSEAGADTLSKKIRTAESLYNSKKYDEALQQFLDAQVELPNDPALRFNVGNTYYKMNNYQEAEKAFSACTALHVDPALQQKAFYNLGNCAYKQGKLEAAVAYFQKAVELDPQDTDAKANLEFVRQEIRKRIHDAQERQKQQESGQEEKQAPPQGPSCPSPQPQPEHKEQQAQHEADSAAESDTEEGRAERSSQRHEPSASPDEATQQGASNAMQAQQARSLTPEEAQRWLSTLSEDQKDMMRRQAQRIFGTKVPPRNDW